MITRLQFATRFSSGKRWAGALALLAGLLPSLGHAQDRADAYAFTQTTGTYTPITGTVISTASDDNVVYPATTLPFTFTYAGTAYTTLRITSNGYVTFGATAPGTAGYTPISSTTGYAGAISAFGLDGGGRSNTGAAISTSTEGTAPNREFVVQYTNWSAYGSVAGSENYQIRLAETSNTIRIVYGTFTGLAAGTNPQVGLRGVAATDFNNRQSAVGWDRTNTGAALTSTATVAVSSTLVPASGLTFIYTPAPTAQLPAIRPTASAVAGNTATVAFVAPATATTAPTSYTATVTPAIAGSPFTVTASPFTLTGLTPLTPYAVSIVATYAAGTSIPTETRFVTGPACAPPTALTISAIATTSASLSFTNYGTGVTDYTVTTTPATTSYTVSSATTAAPLVLTGLTPGTAYTVSVVSNCAAGGVVAATTTTFTTAFACVTPTYATVPYTQTFEGTWVTNCALRDVPSLNWKLTPGATDLDASFRRYDDGVAGGWTGGSTSYGYTPAGSNAGGASSTFSARYHSGNVSPVTEFALFDLYANVSGGTAGTPTLSFDYINVDGTDKIEVLLSTDGGTTFSATPLFTQVVSATWTTYLVPLTGATATSVIRFRATGDNGSSDIGLDNVGVSYVTCSPATAVAVPAATITTTTAQVTFTAPAGSVTNYTVTTSPVTTQANATASPFTLTGLTPGTTYTVTLTTNCSGSAGSSIATSPVSFMTAYPCATPTYVTVPYTQTFENTWVSACALRDVPSLNWKLTPGADPDASFRRYDDGAAAGWTSTLYGYTPAGSNAGGTTSTFSARYHSGNVSPATEFALFDLYANVSGGTGTPTLSFDYINTSGSDKIEVLLSTDGGTTFSTTPLFTQILAATWTTYTVPLTGATATSIIRFRATGDNGSSDIGLDNVSVSYVSCPAPTAVAVPAATITTTTAQVTFTAPANGAASYIVTTSPATTQPNATASPITLTGLTPGTTYTVTLTANCSGGTGNSATTPPISFTTAFACVTPTYATVPYTQTFENTWVSNCALRDVPSLNWKLTPGADLDASFRRYDDGAAAGWLNGSTNYGYTPAGSNAGGASSTFSARYHSGNVSPATEFALFDLYANMSGGTATPTLTFDYINTSGTDKIEVLLSTDGGTTFSTTPLFTQILAASWTTYTVPLTGATATSVIRFRATGDNGSSDIGLDNVKLSYGPLATASALLSAGVSVYPNPAHESFTVQVPAVASAKSVQAELLNALGQVVRKQSAALPAAGTQFTVPTTDLATGVYTLRLRAGDAVLTKRVVIN
jgi:hypothetical protein